MKKKNEHDTDNIAGRRSLPAVNVATFERSQQQDPAQGIENNLYPIYSVLEVGNSFDVITKRNMFGLYFAPSFQEKKKIALSISKKIRKYKRSDKK